MEKISAEQFSMEGDKYLGRTYDDIDCQTFVENAMRDAGLKKDLKGSNAWFREITDNGWTGSPEECKRIFGCVPKGAFLFIHAFDGGERKRGYVDGRGNASHIGFKTGRTGKQMAARAAESGVLDALKWVFGDGAIHSSSSRGHVATSKFADKTISGGGWNMVGLYAKWFTYGAAIDRKLEEIRRGTTEPAQEDESEDTTMGYQARLEGGKLDSGINVRKSPGGALLETVPQGTEVTVTGESGDWCKIQFKQGSRTYTGYVKGEFVVVSDEQPADESGIPDESFDDGSGEKITITLTAAEAANALPVLDKLVDIIVRKVGRG